MQIILLILLIISLCVNGYYVFVLNNYCREQEMVDLFIKELINENTKLKHINEKLLDLDNIEGNEYTIDDFDLEEE